MEAQKLPTLWLKFEQWHFRSAIGFSHIVDERGSTNELGRDKSYRVIIPLCVFSPIALLAAQGSVGFAIGPGAVAERLCVSRFGQRTVAAEEEEEGFLGARDRKRAEQRRRESPFSSPRQMPIGNFCQHACAVAIANSELSRL